MLVYRRMMLLPVNLEVAYIAVAIQRRNAMTVIAGRCLAIGRAAICAVA